MPSGESVDISVRGPVRVKPLALLVLLLVAQSAQSADKLNFFNNWFLNGGAATVGIGLRNTGGAGTLTMTGVPCTSGIGPSAAIVPCTTVGSTPAFPIAAFLYWEEVVGSAAAASANGVFDGNPIVGRLLGSDSVSACWVSASSQTLRAYRADVLRF